MNQEKEQIIDGSKLNFLDRVKNRMLQDNGKINTIEIFM